MPTPDPEHAHETGHAEGQASPGPESDDLQVTDLDFGWATHIRREKEALRATIDARDLAIEQAEELRQVREELRRTREESDAASRKARWDSRWAFAVAVLALFIAVLSWLLPR